MKESKIVFGGQVQRAPVENLVLWLQTGHVGSKKKQDKRKIELEAWTIPAHLVKSSPTCTSKQMYVHCAVHDYHIFALRFQAHP